MDAPRASASAAITQRQLASIVQVRLLSHDPLCAAFRLLRSITCSVCTVAVVHVSLKSIKIACCILCFAPACTPYLPVMIATLGNSQTHTHTIHTPSLFLTHTYACISFLTCANQHAGGFSIRPTFADGWHRSRSLQMES